MAKYRLLGVALACVVMASLVKEANDVGQGRGIDSGSGLWGTSGPIWAAVPGDGTTGTAEASRGGQVSDEVAGEELVVESVPYVVPSGYDTHELQELVCSYDWDCGVASCIVTAESGWGAQAYNGSTDVIGLWQIRWPVHAERVIRLGYSREDLFDPVINTEVAYDIYRDHGRGWGAWDGSPQCWR